MRFSISAPKNRYEMTLKEKASDILYFSFGQQTPWKDKTINELIALYFLFKGSAKSSSLFSYTISRQGFNYKSWSDSNPWLDA